MNKSMKIVLTIAIISLSIIFGIHLHNKSLCAPLEYELKSGVLYCWYKDAWHTQKELAKIGRK